MNTNNEIGIHFIGLTPKEISLFERVISFNITHGLAVEIKNDIANAEIIIVSTESFASMGEINENKTFVVITNDDTIIQGDLQLCRPVMITKAMGALTEAVKVNDEKQGHIATNDIAVDIAIENTTPQAIEPGVEAGSEKINATESILEATKTTTHHALIIDDSAAVRKQLELELRGAGIRSDFAESGEVALEKIKDTHFDLLFLDIIMPGLDGYETCQKIRINPAYKRTPIIMLSGKTSPLDEIQGVIAGATTYLTKPVKSDKLQKVLSRITRWIEDYAPPK